MAGVENIGIIAGGGQFPRLFIEAAHEAGQRVVVIAHKGETDENLGSIADSIYWIKLGQLGKMISIFKETGVTKTVFLGTITKTRIFWDVIPDFKALSLWKKIDRKQDDAILRAIAQTLEEEGITVLESTLYLEHLLFPQGVLTKKNRVAASVTILNLGGKLPGKLGALILVSVLWFATKQ
jgi:DUF1009 family protein